MCLLSLRIGGEFWGIQSRAGIPSLTKPYNLPVLIGVYGPLLTAGLHYYMAQKSYSEEPLLHGTITWHFRRTEMLGGRSPLVPPISSFSSSWQGCAWLRE